MVQYQLNRSLIFSARVCPRFESGSRNSMLTHTATLSVFLGLLTIDPALSSGFNFPNVQPLDQLIHGVWAESLPVL